MNLLKSITERKEDPKIEGVSFGRKVAEKHCGSYKDFEKHYAKSTYGKLQEDGHNQDGTKKMKFVPDSDQKTKLQTAYTVLTGRDPLKEK